MTNRSTLTVVLLLVVTLACQSVPRPHAIPLDPQFTILKSYSLGSEYQSHTGSPMVTTQEGYLLPSFLGLDEFKPEHLGRQVPMGVEWVAGHQFLGAGLCGDAEYVITNPTYYNGFVGFVVNAQGVLPCDFAAFQVTGRKAGRTWALKEMAGRQGFKPTEGLPIPGKRSMKRELLYNGQSGSTIFVLYREYIDDMLRPAFSQELRYDLGDSPHVTFNQWEIEVLGASNEGIRFRVLRD